MGAKRFTDWVRTLFGPDRWVETCLSIVAVLGGCVGAIDLLTRLGAWIARDEIVRFKFYLWASFLVLVVMPAAWLILYRLLRREVAAATKTAEERKLATELGRLAGEIQHRMAEAVRRCAADVATYDLAKDIVRVMTELTAYLRLRLGDRKYAITIKRTTPGKGTLDMVFRDGGQNLESRCNWNHVPLDDSPIYSRFSKATHTKKIVFIGDTNRMPSTEDPFRLRAQECGYQTVMGFPLRLPAPIGAPEDGARATGEFKFANLLGFFSIDTPDVGAFEELLMPGATRDDDREPRDDLDVFYGIADSLATILVLTSAASRHGDGGQNADDHA